MAFTIIRGVSISAITPIFKKVIKPKITGEERNRRAHKGAKNVYKTIFYTASTIAGYYVCKDLAGLPPMMFGKG